MDDEIAVTALAALAHPDRLAAFRMLVKAGPNGLPSGEIAGRLAISPNRMSFHLTALERSNLVSSRRAGRHILYAASYEAMRKLLAFLTEDCCGGRPEICGDLGALLPDCTEDVCQ
ncbi:ArsR/SmtB family transcription factor [Aurantimonas marianensis]|uniref:Metalloregulator ArsR/SmtB family transcription factor n=1 Tax=Aurantimonas marianensis TaxID=2920428 RepID=A0A9X2KDW0_9HYPH|nr:metalloregulator ArsR/SmtB family transcription factor [Aurantimonas marianensis]MCP3053994.1 metalloregulator ArsR/SmtB family transcription factor [Aurantimonas marianensis]